MSQVPAQTAGVQGKAPNIWHPPQLESWRAEEEASQPGVDGGKPDWASSLDDN